MSKDIWHNADKKPMLHTEIILCGDGWSMAMGIIPETVNNICWKNVEKWCYLDDLLALETELDHTRKALDKAKLILKNLLPYLNGYERLDVKKALEQITALEQKDKLCGGN